MMILKEYENFLTQSLAFWVGSADKNNRPDLARCTGLAPLSDYERITLFIPTKFAGQILTNTKENKNITLSATSVVTYNSYQFKGVFESVRDCTSKEEAAQLEYLDGFSTLVSRLGFSKEAFFAIFNHQPSHAV